MEDWTYRPDLSAVVRMTKEEGPWEVSPGFSLGLHVFMRRPVSRTAREPAMRLAKIPIANPILEFAF
jgi:hypothetical protein